jgi:hypothetical protein
MQTKTSPVYQIFEQQHQEAKDLFLELGKQIKSKKAIELSAKMDFLELYSDLMGKIHFEKEELKFDFFSPFKPLKKSLRKIHHFKLIEKNLKSREASTGLRYESYRNHLEAQKKKIYQEAFDLIVGSSLKSWDDFLIKSLQASKGIKPLMINTAINQIIQEELEFFSLDHQPPLESKFFRDLFEGLRMIIMLENLLIHLGFNPIFLSSVHQEINELKENLKPWYSNHLTLQTLSHFLGEKPEVSKKYLEWIKGLKEEKKSLSSQIERQAMELFKKVLI